MRTIKATPFVSTPFPQSAAAIGDEESPSAAESARADEEWKDLIDHKLIEWGRDPSVLDEEGTISPSQQTIQFAIALGWIWRNMGLPAPTRIVPDAHGAIVFEFHRKNVSETFRLTPDIGLEYCVFEGSRLVQRQFLASPFSNGTGA
jgi:hypothetical protein